MNLIPIETKLHISSTEWNVLILQIPPISVKRWVPNLKQDQQYVYYQRVKEKHK